MLLTKFSDWKYENEVRIFLELKEVAEFDDDFQLVSSILGPSGSLLVSQMGQR